MGVEDTGGTEGEPMEYSGGESDDTLPSPDDLGVGDMSDMDNPEL
jgi:hypothetical protein